MSIAVTATAIGVPDVTMASDLRPAMDPRTWRLLHAPILPTLLGMAWPNILVMVAQASTGLIETWWVSRLGTDALAGMALVFPGFMMMQMLSAGAMGGGISSAIARALGAGRRDDADALVMHALIINGLFGLGFAALFLLLGPQIYRAMGGEGGSLAAALQYSGIVFAGTPLVWLMNAVASTIRGTGNMLVPSAAVCVGVLLLIPLSPLLIFGIGPVPALGVAGAGAAVVLTTALTGGVLCWYLLSPRSMVRPRLARLRWTYFADILRVGVVGSVNTLQTTLTVALTTALVGIAAGLGRRRRLWNGFATGVSADPPGVRPRRTARGAGGHQHRRRPAAASLARGAAGRGGRLLPGRGDRHRRGALADGLAQPVRHRSAHAGDRCGLSAHGRPDLRLLRPRPVPLFRLPGSRPAALAAPGRARPHAAGDRRRLAGPAPDRLAHLAVPGPRRGAGRLWQHAPGRHRLGRVVSRAGGIDPARRAAHDQGWRRFQTPGAISSGQPAPS